MNPSRIDNPAWWTDEHSSRWERVKNAFRRDWEQTKYDLGSDQASDLQQSASDTFRQAAGKQPQRGFDDLEPAFRYGYGARSQYGSSAWDADTERRLGTDYPGDFQRDREFVRRGYEYTGMP